MAKNDFQYGGWNYYTLQCGTIMTLISPSDYTLQCGTWLDHHNEFTKWQHPAMWYMALGWHAMEFAQTSAILEFYILVSILTISPQSTCHSAPVSEILSKSDHSQQKKMTSCRFSRWRISAILDFTGPITGSLKSPCTNSYRSSEIIALNCLVFEKIAFFPRDAMHKRGLCRHAVSVRLCVLNVRGSCQNE